MKGILLTRLSIFAVAALMSTPFCSAQANLAGDWQGSFDAEWHHIPTRLACHCRC